MLLRAGLSVDQTEDQTKLDLIRDSFDLIASMSLQNVWPTKKSPVRGSIVTGRKRRGVKSGALLE